MTDRIVVLNPKSGGGRAADRVRKLATARGFDVRASSRAGETLEIAREAAATADLVVAAGGDGTLNEVARGVVDADALDSTTVGVVPSGTGNNFAARVGVRSVQHAFDVLDADRRRRIDLGFVDDRSFVNSCVGGLTADASAATTPEMKRRWGVLAYVVATLREYRTFDGLHLDVYDGDGGVHWSGDAIGVLVGNGRRFVGEPGTQANMEDGLLNVVVFTDRPASSLLGDEAVRRLLGRDGEHVTRLKASDLHLDVQTPGGAAFSLDGEIVTRESVAIRAEPRCLSFCVGERYRPIPGA